MLVKEALDILKQVCANYRGTLQEHQALQTALQTVEKKCSEYTQSVKKVDKEPVKES